MPAASSPKRGSKVERVALSSIYKVKVVRVVGGTEKWISVSETTTVDELKSLLNDWGKNARQILVFAGSPLRDGGATLRSLSIGDGATILFIGKVTPAKEEKLQLRWIVYARDEVRLSKNNRYAYKISHSPDVSLIFGNRSFSQGFVRFDVLVHAKGDEMWIGVTDRPNLLRSVSGGTIRRHPRIWAYCDGSRGKNFVCGGTKLPSCAPDVYSKVGFELNWKENIMKIYKNGVVQGCLRGLPAGPLTPFVALDDANDAVEFVRSRGYKT